ncbi:MAG: Na+/H+ antiporter subunit E [Eubacteriales bacterium]
MPILLLGLWFLLNGSITVEIVVVGVLMVGVVYNIMCRFLDYDPSSEKILLKNTGWALCYVVVLVVEIMKSGMAVLKFVTMPQIDIQPQMVVFSVPLKNEFLKTILANSITLTPGTITLHIEEDLFYIHAFDYTLAEGIEECSFIHILQHIEEGIA